MFRKLTDALRGSPGPAPEGGVRRIELDYPFHPRPRELRAGAAGKQLLARLEASVPGARVLAGRIAALDPFLRRIPLAAGPDLDPATPVWRNGWFPPLDAVTLYGLLALVNPRWLVEVGSGNSTRFARRAIRDHGLRTKILSIDPCPRAEIDAICDRVLRAPLEDVELSELAGLSSEDLLFVDSSHRSFQNSDVTVFFTEILPALPPGLLYGIHDIHLPFDYPPEMTDRFYNEQYLLAAYLAGGAGGDEVVAPLMYLYHLSDVPAAYAPTFTAVGLEALERNGNSFWMRRKG
ncbi:MAG TPA: class I SAM-dependent methyltransferase [Planctomycetota bacterium]